MGSKIKIALRKKKKKELTLFHFFALLFPKACKLAVT